MSKITNKSLYPEGLDRIADGLENLQSVICMYGGAAYFRMQNTMPPLHHWAKAPNAVTAAKAAAAAAAATAAAAQAAAAQAAAAQAASAAATAAAATAAVAAAAAAVAAPSGPAMTQA